EAWRISLMSERHLITALTALAIPACAPRPTRRPGGGIRRLVGFPGGLRACRGWLVRWHRRATPGYWPTWRPIDNPDGRRGRWRTGKSGSSWPPAAPDWPLENTNR